MELDLIGSYAFVPVFNREIDARRLLNNDFNYTATVTRKNVAGMEVASSADHSLGRSSPQLRMRS
jgi:hypothetical protein